jgi:CRISPR-associated protein Cas5d
VTPRRCKETFRVRVRGPLACFTRPEFKVERVSYEVMTPSAARGVLEAIHWKPGIRWVITAIHILAPVNFVSFKRNEVAGRVSTQIATRGMQGESVPPYFADEDRQQRNTMALRDVDYVIEAHFFTTPRFGPDDTVPKHVEMFMRRLERGQTFHQPYLGCREFAAAVEPAGEIPECHLPATWRDRDLGLMLHDLEFDRSDKRIVPRFFRARIDSVGRIAVPPFEETVVADGLTREGDV